MKKFSIVLSFIGIIGFIIFQFGNRTTEANGQQDLLTLAKILHDENIIINEWSLHAREKMETFQTAHAVEQHIDALQQEFSSWKWSNFDGKKHREVSAVSSGPTYQEKIRLLITPANEEFHAYLIYEVNGKQWSETSENFLKIGIAERISDIFRGKATIFSCIKGEFNDKLKTALPEYVNMLLEVLNGKEIEALQEDSFISMSAYSPLFAAELKGKSEKMNFQLALRNQGLGGKTSIVVGTPIITIEY
ncbi:YwmB family TATA-box binding protein [Bacillus sp. V33-4]|uniref:YwmB family TATA-box binding protein n=1 Tax=Bacillus sp. V33-4 TaxID=2054169 RepID=UPI000C794563|nr:YwmB family TATA-box binding protein [Bacillus sp. V33-4]PLR85454.1 hypothetical protein CVD23_08740 [Bacillus sp. V33-4]